ncbi:hypothetical protein, partial [Pseudomonas sp. AM8]|uniref:hypothetical protein n=1 Tax=Pseudomonas sp. AM8 TaxID=2983368 RepID=UPI002E816242
LCEPSYTGLGGSGGCFSPGDQVLLVATASERWLLSFVICVDTNFGACNNGHRFGNESRVSGFVSISQKDSYGIWINQRISWVIIMNWFCHLITREKT